MDSVGEELERLARLKASGDLSDEEYELLKSRFLDSIPNEPEPEPEPIKKKKSMKDFFIRTLTLRRLDE